MSERSWLEDARSITSDGLVPCAECGNRCKFIDLKKFKIHGEQKMVCNSCITKERERARKERETDKPREPVSRVKRPVVDVKEITDGQEKIVTMLEEIQKSVTATPVQAMPSINFHASPPSIESLFHLIRSSNKIVENDLCRSFKEYYAHAKYLVLEMRVRDYVWKDDHGWLMINPMLGIDRIKKLDPWYELDKPTTEETYIDGLKKKAIRFKFKPMSLLSFSERARMLRVVFETNVHVDDEASISIFDATYEDFLSLKPRSRKRVHELNEKIATLTGLVMAVLENDV